MWADSPLGVGGARRQIILKMNEQLTIAQNKFETFPATSRVWIYQSKTAFSETDVTEIRGHIAAFTQQWASHNRALQATGDVLHGRFIVLMVDESQAGASGCSIDSSVHFVNTKADFDQRWKVRLGDSWHQRMV